MTGVDFGEGIGCDVPDKKKEKKEWALVTTWAVRCIIKCSKISALIHLLFKVTVENALLRTCAVRCTIVPEATTILKKIYLPSDSL
jgi:hypothetical protein